MRKGMAWVMVLVAGVIMLAAGGCQSGSQGPAGSGEAADVQAVGAEKAAIEAENSGKPAETASQRTPQTQVVEDGPRGNAGELVVDEPVYDFGTVDPQATVTGKFTLRNSGTAAVEIDPAKIGKDCGCTVPVLRDTTIEPGESVDLEFSFHAPRNPGPVTKKVWLLTEAPARPERVDLKISATVREFLRVSPAQFEIPLQNGEQPAQTVVVESTDGTKFRVLAVSGAGEGMTAKFDNTAEAARHQIVVTADPEKMPRTSRGMLRIRTDHSKVEEMYVQYNVTLPFTTYPTVKRFLEASGGHTEESTIDVVSNFGGEFELGEVRSEKGLVEVVERARRGDGWRLRVRMTVPEDSELTRFRDYLVIPIKDHPQDTQRVLCYYVQV